MTAPNAAKAELHNLGSIRLSPQQFEWISALRRIYEFESGRISGPGSWRRDIAEALWTQGELIETLHLTPNESKEYAAVVDWMVKHRHAMKVPGSREGQPRFITRVAEIVRILGHTHEYWRNGRPAVDAIRWLIENKRVPRRDISPSVFIDSLTQSIDAFVAAKWKSGLSDAAKTVVTAVAETISERVGLGDAGKVRFSKFQLDATREMLLSEFGKELRKRAHVITAGVGSGKSFAFQIPIFVSALARLKAGETERRTSLVVYPRKALALDQYDAILRIISKINNPYLLAHLEHYDGYQRRARKSSVIEGLEEVYGGVAPPPAIIVTTLETLKRRLQYPSFIKKVSSRLNRLVVDEVHLVEGLGGGNVIRMMDRLRAACASSRIIWTASSATVAAPHEHVSTLFGVLPSQIGIIQPSEEEMDVVGLAHHVFLRPTGNISPLGTLVNVTSLTVHNRRIDVGERSRGEAQLKTIGFADNLDLLGRWNADLREDERTEEARRLGKDERVHASSGDINAWNRRQRELPYALRFRHPLEARIRAKGDAYLPVLTDYANSHVCDACQAGERKSLGVLGPEEMRRLSTIVYRRPEFPTDKLELYSIWNPLFFRGISQEVGTLDLCPYLRAGACSWFPVETEDIAPIPHTQKFEWKSIARSKIHTAKTTKETLADDLTEIVFKGTVREVYDVTDADSDSEIPVDVVLASPSLEVGIDLPNVTESIMFHAIRNVASYRQKVGRIGREEGSDTLNVTLVASRPIDLHFYRQPRKLVSLAQLDPIPLRDTNYSILRSAIYMGVWDWLALATPLPERIPMSTASPTEFGTRLRDSLNQLKSRRRDISKYLSQISRNAYEPDSKDVTEVLDQVEAELGFLVSDVTKIFPGVSMLCDLVPNLVSEHGKKIPPAPDTAEQFDELIHSTSQYWEVRSKLNPIVLELSDEFRQLDLMARCGWDYARLQMCIDRLLPKVSTFESGPQGRPLRRVLRHLEDVADALKELQCDCKPLFFYNQLKTFSQKSPAQAHYLSFMMESLDVFRLFRSKPDYARIKNLFSNPYEEEVEIALGYGQEDHVTLAEALFSLVPGSWTYRFGKRPIKVKSGPLRPSDGGVLTAGLNSMIEQQSHFLPLKQGVPGPPGFHQDFDVVRPTRLQAMNLNEKYVRLNRQSGCVADGDESPTQSGSKDDPFVKIPKTYFNKWVHVEPDQGIPIGLSQYDIKSLAILSPAGTIESEGQAASSKISHPITGLLDGTFWHRKLQVTEFVYSCSRSYTSKQISGIELEFEGSTGRPLAFGRSVETEGFSIQLEKSIVVSVRDLILNELELGKSEWFPTLVKALSSYLSSVSAKTSLRIGPYVIRDLVALITHVVDFKREKWSPAGFAHAIELLLDDRSLFNELAELHYKGNFLLEQNDNESIRIADSSDGQAHMKADAQNKASQLAKSAASLPPFDPNDFMAYLRRWVTYALLNSFGAAACDALQRLAGVRDDIVGYAVDLSSVDKNLFRVFLYDKDAYGSGSSAVASRFLHILHIQRHGVDIESSLLPSDDFYTVLEEELLQCPQHHTDISALAMLDQELKSQERLGMPTLGYVREYAREVLDNSGPTWKKLGIASRVDAWRLPIMNLQAHIIAHKNSMEADDVIRSTTICWNGCPECLLNRESVMGGLVGEWLLDKAVLDKWFSLGRSKVREYREVDVSQLVNGSAGLSFGTLSNVVLNLQNRRVRSVSLPYTIGIDIGRESSDSARLLIRTSDMVGHSLFMPGTQNLATHGIESLGFKRLFWHDLVLTAFLDQMGMIPPERRRIVAVYFDCRDISFDDIGVSPRMLDAIMEASRKDNVLEVPERLSDMLMWLARREFDISICVDKTRLQEAGVRTFVDKLVGAGCKVRSKDSGGSMHKKAFITPLGAITGTTNLTESGMRVNEEINSYAHFGSQAYLEIGTAVNDTFHGSVPAP